MLGFNDMGWFYSDAPGTIDSVDTFVANARAANPNVNIALANVPQRSFIGGREDLVENTEIYNQLLPEYIADWTTEQSPIYLVELEENYVSTFEYNRCQRPFAKSCTFRFVGLPTRQLSGGYVPVLCVRCRPLSTQLIHCRLRRLTPKCMGRVPDCERILSDASQQFRVGHYSTRSSCSGRF
jgi:hypothetical protein